MKKVKVIIFTFILIAFIISNTVYGASGSIWDTAKEWLDVGSRNGARFNTDITTTGFEEIAGLLFGLGIFVAIGSAIVLGIRYMFASVETKSQITQAMAPFLIGTIIIVGALGIWKLCIGILDI